MDALAVAPRGNRSSLTPRPHPGTTVDYQSDAVVLKRVAIDRCLRRLIDSEARAGTRSLHHVQSEPTARPIVTADAIRPCDTVRASIDREAVDTHVPRIIHRVNDHLTARAPH